MTTINVLVAVNVGMAISTGNLSQYVFMVDTTGYSGNGNEGGNELLTTCTNGDTVIWNVVSIDPSENVAILGFSGAAIPNMINPGQYPQYAGTVWGGRVNSAGSEIQYSLELLLEGNVQQSFDPFLTANNALNLR
ncbi:hypothetical protein ACFDR9_005675 [Janthinobacterium sp. CG_23.3]|uniref:hypothetical protein n=1 Tax=unclassified Janthinobacterium TaxID=2610881 RepID=UPI000477D544|nr:MULTISPECIES: hypothetical protein [unclassified Janthinobacterium]MEC5159744.1 hypothetical protein [Janthinobacterium sp. CG_S6]